MKSSRTWFVLGPALLVALPSVLAGAPDGQWTKIEEAIQRQQPRTAITLLDDVLTQALAQKAFPEAARALTQKITVEAGIQGSKAEDKIRRLEAALTNAPAELHPILNAIQAEWLNQCAAGRAYVFLARRAAAGSGADDLETEDLAGLHRRIIHQYDNVFAAADQLKKTRITDYDALLVKGSLPDRYQPTLYDFAVGQAIAFYGSADSMSSPDVSRTPMATADLLAPVERFIGWRLPETNSFVARTLLLYQKWLSFHRQDSDPTAFLDIDVQRLILGHNILDTEEADERARSVFRSFAEEHETNEVSAQAWAHLAEAEHEAGNLATAHELALRGCARFPDSVGGKQCRRLRDYIESPWLRLTTERVWCAPFPKIIVRYRNLNALYFRAIPQVVAALAEASSEEVQEIERGDEAIAKLLREKPALEWSNTLSATIDYRSRTARLDAPETLKPGLYQILASRNPDFSTNDDALRLVTVWVSQLALLPLKDRIEGLVVDARSGEPIPGALAEVAYPDEQREKAVKAALRTDASGIFALPLKRRGEDETGPEGYAVSVRYRGNQIRSTPEAIELDSDRGDQRQARTIFFTDRGIYRPGQTIYYKGLCIEFDHGRNVYRVLPGRNVALKFEQPGSTPMRTTHRCNQFGSFSGSFRLPEHGPTGIASLGVDPGSGAPGEVHFRIEEYKRPKFQVHLDPAKVSPRLGQMVRLTGQALGYNATPLSDAVVGFAVHRSAFKDRWGGGWRVDLQRNTSWVVANGATTTDSEGRFAIDFLARGANPKEEDTALYEFHVSATVTDSLGETETADRSVGVAKSGLHAILSAPEWLTDRQPVPLRVRTETLDAQPIAASGRISVFSLQAPPQVIRPDLVFLDLVQHEPFSPSEFDESDLTNPADFHNWPTNAPVADQGFFTGSDGGTNVLFALPAGAYRAVLQAPDAWGAPTRQELSFAVISPEKKRFDLKVPDALFVSAESVQPGEEVQAVWGTGYERGRAFVEVECAGHTLQRYWTKPNQTQATIRVRATEAMRGGFTLRVTSVRENRAYIHDRVIDVPWGNKTLDVRWERFSSKLSPGTEETWTAVIQGSNAPSAAMEMVAVLYDASLDALTRWERRWPSPFHQIQPEPYGREASIFRIEPAKNEEERGPRFFTNLEQPFRFITDDWEERGALYAQPSSERVSYRRFPNWLSPYSLTPRRFTFSRRSFGHAITSITMGIAKGPKPEPTTPPKMNARAAAEREQPIRELASVTPRRDFGETAFFFPHLRPDENGLVRLQFKVPDSLTQWRFLGFAHDTSLRSGFVEREAVSFKDFMVEANPPRFLREGDRIDFPVRLANRGDLGQSGIVRLTLSEAESAQESSLVLGSPAERSFELPAKGSQTITWRLPAPSNVGLVKYKAVGATPTFSDGEEGLMPVLPRGVLVTESMTLPLRETGERTFTFGPLLASAQVSNIIHQSLVVQIVSNPSWHVLLGLAAVAESRDDACDAVFQRWFAAALLKRLLRSEPALRETVARWQQTSRRQGALELNPDLKAVALEETPWLAEAKNETERLARLAELLAPEELERMSAREFEQLEAWQCGDGSWPWFAGGKGNEYITFSLVAGFGRLKNLNIGTNEFPRARMPSMRPNRARQPLRGTNDPALPTIRRQGFWIQPALFATDYIDAWLESEFRTAQKTSNTNLGLTVPLALYARSFFLTERPLDEHNRQPISHFLELAKADWPHWTSRQAQAQLAIAFHRFGDQAAAEEIIKSLKERAIVESDSGMFWREDRGAWRWFQAPIENQVAVIEALKEVGKDEKAVADCIEWLLGQKRTHAWRTLHATSEAVFGLLLGNRELATAPFVELTLGGKKVPLDGGEPGSGWVEERIPPEQIEPGSGTIAIRKTGAGLAWASVHWQSLQDIAAASSADRLPLEVRKRLYRAAPPSRGRLLEELSSPLNPGDELIVRLEIRSEEDFEFVHLRDQRASALEPMQPLSHHGYQGGLTYFESVRDTGSDFYFDHLPRGVFVLDVPLRAVHRGVVQTGMTVIECVYAPEFRSHAPSQTIEIR